MDQSNIVNSRSTAAVLPAPITKVVGVVNHVYIPNREEMRPVMPDWNFSCHGYDWHAEATSTMLKLGKGLIGRYYAFRISLQVQEEDIVVTLLEPTGKVLGTEHAALEDSFAGAKENAVLLIAREFDAHSDEEWNQIRRNISWTAQP